MDPAAPFYIASVTKGFVAAIVAQLAAEGVLDLDDPLSRWLPDWPTGDRISVRQLLNHTGGVPSLFNNDVRHIWQPILLADLQRVWTPLESLSYIRDEPLLFEPGTGYHYSNANYILAGLVIEAATGRPLAEEIRTRLTEPLGLTETYLDSGFGPTPERIPHLFYDLADNGTYIDVRGFPRTAVVSLYWAAGGMLSTPADLLTWAGALYGGTRVLPREWRNQLTDLGTLGYGFANFGLCPCASDGAGGVTYAGRGHDGDFPGFRTFLGYWADVDVAIVLYVNQSPIDYENFRRGIEGARLLIR
jgi:D-alanyl-D-alanine carboxypeptidase